MQRQEATDPPKVHRILVVDSEPSIRALLSKVFVRAGFHATTAADARQAVALLESEPFDVLLAGVDLKPVPAVDGHELARWAAQNQLAVRCVLMEIMDSGCENCPFLARCHKLVKPFSPKQAVSVVRQILRGENPPSASEEAPR
jgi:DNA-binding response OmpR family regulator